MAKFDTTAIEGWENLDSEAKLNALLNADIPDAVDMSKFIAKSSFDKTASELAEAKRQLKAKMSDDEVKAAEQTAKYTDMETKYNELLKKSTVSEYKSKYLGMGYSEDNASAMAEAQYGGDSTKMFEIMNSHNASLKETIKSQLLKETPKPKGAGGEPQVEKTADILLAEKLAKSAVDRNKITNDVLSRYK